MSSDERGPVIPLSVPHVAGNEWKYVKECLDTGWVSSVGPFVERFEREVASRIGSRFGIATSSGTAALHLALQVAGVEAGDEVLVSVLTFIAPANAVRYVGAWPVFIDAEPKYWQMDPDRLDAFLSKECERRQGALYNRTTGRRVRAILPVHILGHPCDFDPILALARSHGLRVIEDATESLGGLYKGRLVGHLGDIACFSFNGNKLLTTGGGGMLVTDQEDWATKARYLSTQAKDDAVEYIHNEIGYNYRLSNVQAAIGSAQLEQIDEFLTMKRAIAATYHQAFQSVPGITPMPEAPWATSAFWLYTILIEPGLAAINRTVLLSQLKNAGVEARPLWQPLHRSPAHRRSAAECPVAESLYHRALSLPSSVHLSPDQQNHVIQSVKRAMTAAAV